MSASVIQTKEQTSSSSTNVKTVKLTHTWVIDDFLTYYETAGYATKLRNNSCKVIESARFKNQHVQLYLQCYPYEHNFTTTHYVSGTGDEYYGRSYDREKKEMYLAVKLYLVSSKLGKSNVNFEIWCLHANGEMFGIPGKFPIGEQCGIPHGSDLFIKKSNLNQFLVDKKLSFHCEISYITTATSAPFDNALEENHFEKMANNFAKLRRDSNFSDITLMVGGKEFRAHKFWLCAQSPVFEAMFLRHDTKEKQENRVEITDVDSSVFEKLLDFIYSGKSECVRGREDELLAAADKYGLEQLKDACADELCKKLTPVSVTDLLVLGDTYNVSKLKQKSLDYLRVHGQDTIQAMFANNQTDNLVSAFRHLEMPGNSSRSSPGSSNQNSIRGRNDNSQARLNNNRNSRPRGGRGGNQSNRNSNN